MLAGHSQLWEVEQQVQVVSLQTVGVGQGHTVMLDTLVGLPCGLSEPGSGWVWWCETWCGVSRLGMAWCCGAARYMCNAHGGRGGMSPPHSPPLTAAPAP